MSPLRTAALLTLLSAPVIAHAECVSGNCTDGTGKYVYADGGVYEGSFRSSFRDGQGVYTWAGKDRYEGSWTGGSQNGQGAYYTADGKLDYSGPWVQGQRSSGSAGIASGGSGPKPEGIDLAAVKAPVSAGESQPQAAAATNGCVSGNCTDGVGSYSYATGDRYEGLFGNGKRNGLGTYTWKSGAKYVGNWSGDEQDGQGTLFNADGSAGYAGVWKNGQQATPAPAAAVSSIVTIGSDGIGSGGAGGQSCISGDCAAGVGKYRYADGAVYEGRFANSMRNGHGTYTWLDGAQYVGNWVNDKQAGFGTWTFADKRKFEGVFENGSRTLGTFYWNDGSKYIGPFKGDKMGGYGTILQSDGSSFVGHFDNDAKNGDGISYRADGSIEYSGAWKDGQKAVR